MVIGNPPRFMQLLAKRTKLAILGKGMQSACAIDPTLIRGGWKNPEGTVISLLIDETPAMMMYKNDQGQFLYTGSGVAEQTSPGGYAGSVILRVRSLTEFLRLATYRESTTDALARGRISIEGSLSLACGFLRIVSLTEIYLLPRHLACRAVKRYQAPPQLIRRKILIYIHMVFLHKGVSHGNP